MLDEQWEAIVNCDASYDGKFFYAVETTGIFCRPSCKSRTTKKEHVRLFLSIEEAVEAKFRPCKRCRPDQLRWPDEELAYYTARFIEQHYAEALTLNRIAKGLHFSPYYLHRIFKRIMNMTPADYLVMTRISQAKRLLIESDKSVTEIAGMVGFVNTGHFSTVFLKMEGISPTKYRSLYSNKLLKNGVSSHGRKDVLGRIST